MYKSKEEMMSDLNFYHRYMFYEQIKNLNEFWAILAKSNDKHPAIMESNIIDYMKNSPNFIKPIEWVDIFTKNICKDTSVQTDDIKNNTSEISTQTSNENVQNKNNLIRSNSSKSENSYANAVNFNPNKSTKNKESEIYNVKTNNYYEKLSFNINQPIKTAQKSSTEAPSKMNFNKKTPSKGTSSRNNPQPKGNTIHQNLPSTNRKQQGKPTNNFNLREPKFTARVYSPSLQRDRWQRETPHFNGNLPNNFNFNRKNENHFNSRSHSKNQNFRKNRELERNFNYMRSYSNNQSFH